MSKVYETSENAKKEFLQTRYYKTSDFKLLERIPDVLKSMNCEILGINKDYAEISAYNDKYDITVKVVNTAINETSVDVFVSSRYLIDINKSKNIIIDFYTRLGKEFEFIGLALNRNKNEK